MLLLFFLVLMASRPLLCSARFFDRCFPDMLPEYQCYNPFKPYTNSLWHYPESPTDQGITFELFTEPNQTKAQILEARDESSVKNSDFVPAGKVAIITHGFMSSTDNHWVGNLVEKLLTKVPNVIAVDWRVGARGKNYFRAVANTRVVGAQIATLIKTLGVQPGEVHLIGHSLGAHVMGYAGEKFTTDKIGRITGLDAAGPAFQGHDIRVRLDPSDAAFVDAIHTDAEPFLKKGLGIKDACGHVDFYPNGGHSMPGCDTTIELSDLTGRKGDCSHSKAHKYFAASIDGNDFQAYPCPSVEDYKKGLCTSCESGCNHMGYGASPKREGIFVLDTGAKYPYLLE